MRCMQHTGRAIQKWIQFLKNKKVRFRQRKRSKKENKHFGLSYNFCVCCYRRRSAVVCTFSFSKILSRKKSVRFCTFYHLTRTHSIRAKHCMHDLHSRHLIRIPFADIEVEKPHFFPVSSSTPLPFCSRRSLTHSISLILLIHSCMCCNDRESMRVCSPKWQTHTHAMCTNITTIECVVNKLNKLKFYLSSFLLSEFLLFSLSLSLSHIRDGSRFVLSALSLSIYSFLIKCLFRCEYAMCVRLYTPCIQSSKSRIFEQTTATERAGSIFIAQTLILFMSINNWKDDSEVKNK